MNSSLSARQRANIEWMKTSPIYRVACQIGQAKGNIRIAQSRGDAAMLQLWWTRLAAYTAELERLTSE